MPGSSFQDPKLSWQFLTLSALDFSFCVTTSAREAWLARDVVCSDSGVGFLLFIQNKENLSAGLGRLSPHRDTQQGARGTELSPAATLTWRPSGQGPGEDVVFKSVKVSLPYPPREAFVCFPKAPSGLL